VTAGGEETSSPALDRVQPMITNGINILMIISLRIIH
jgi:hypothetical protein